MKPGLWLYLAAIASKYWKMTSFGTTKESNDAKLRALRMRGKGKRKYQRYKNPRGKP